MDMDMHGGLDGVNGGFGSGVERRRGRMVY